MRNITDTKYKDTSTNEVYEVINVAVASVELSDIGWVCEKELDTWIDKGTVKRI